MGAGTDNAYFNGFMQTCKTFWARNNKPKLKTPFTVAFGGSA